MKKTIITAMAAGLVAAVASAEVSVSMDFVSAYVFRGATFLDGASFQPGIEVSGFEFPEEYGSVAVGAWGSADLDGDNSSSFQESDWYASYALPVEAVDVSVGYCEYSYGAGSADKEMSIGLGYDLSGVALGVGTYIMAGGDFAGQVYADLSAGYDIEASSNLVVSVGARVGAYLDREDSSTMDTGLSDYDLSVGASYALSEAWSAGVSLAYIGQLDDEVLSDDDYDVDVVGMFSLACDM
jgi:uncharacterized protein (TIGR02001 family)